MVKLNQEYVLLMDYMMQHAASYYGGTSGADCVEFSRVWLRTRAALKDQKLMDGTNWIAIWTRLTESRGY